MPNNQLTWAERNPEKRRKVARDWARRNRATLKKHSKVWNLRNPTYMPFEVQKCTAKRRGIEFLFTRSEWLTWWGTDFDKRGLEGTDLCMCRYNDTGPYSPDNTYKATRAENSRGPRNAVN